MFIAIDKFIWISKNILPMSFGGHAMATKGYSKMLLKFIYYSHSLSISNVFKLIFYLFIFVNLNLKIVVKKSSSNTLMHFIYIISILFILILNPSLFYYICMYLYLRETQSFLFQLWDSSLISLHHHSNMCFGR
jgi:hypothetical protein